MRYSRTIEMDLPYDEAAIRVKQAFREQGVGTLREIDVQATLNEEAPRGHGR